MKTYFCSQEAAGASRKWCVVDADGQVVGRLASQIASILRGKNKPSYAPHTDTGDYVVVVNVDKVKFTGRKFDNKKYYRHTGYVGGLVERTAREIAEKKPTEILRHAVHGMLPKGALGRKQIKKLKLYTGSEHPHTAQQGESVSLG